MINENEARELIIQAGLELLENDLVQRTWGNISAKVSNNEFIITPSGIPYEKLTKEDLVKVNMTTLEYEGNLKPSSEKGLHANCYLIREDIDFIIHTHQKYATSLSLLKEDLPFAKYVEYGLPGTKKLSGNVALKVYDNMDSNSFLLERHGVIVLGKTKDDAFSEINKLESLSKEYYAKVSTSNVKEKDELKPYLDDYAQMFGLNNKPVENDPETLELIRNKNIIASHITGVKKMNFFDTFLQHFVFKKKYSKLKDNK